MEEAPGREEAHSEEGAELVSSCTYLLRLLARGAGVSARDRGTLQSHLSAGEVGHGIALGSKMGTCPSGFDRRRGTKDTRQGIPRPYGVSEDRVFLADSEGANA